MQRIVLKPGIANITIKKAAYTPTLYSAGVVYEETDELYSFYKNYFDLENQEVLEYKDAKSYLYSFEQLTVAGTKTPIVAADDFTKAIYQYKILGSTTNTIFTIEGSLDNESWYNLNDTENHFTIYEDGVYSTKINLDSDAYIRFNWVSGTTGTIDIKLKLVK